MIPVLAVRGALTGLGLVAKLAVYVAIIAGAAWVAAQAGLIDPVDLLRALFGV